MNFCKYWNKHWTISKLYLKIQKFKEIWTKRTYTHTLCIFLRHWGFFSLSFCSLNEPAAWMFALNEVVILTSHAFDDMNSSGFWSPINGYLTQILFAILKSLNIFLEYNFRREIFLYIYIYIHSIDRFNYIIFSVGIEMRGWNDNDSNIVKWKHLKFDTDTVLSTLFGCHQLAQRMVSKGETKNNRIASECIMVAI